MPKEICFGKNVSLKAGNITVIQGFQNKTRKNFSATLNIIIEQWDKLSVQIAKYERDIHMENLNKAEVIKK